MGSAKTGRPKSNNPKEYDVKVRLDILTHQALVDYCERKNMTKASAIRKGIDLLLQTDK